MRKIFLDIETLPAAGDKVDLVKRLWQESVGKASASESKFEDYFRGTSLQGEFGRIFCICYALDDKKTGSISGDEKKMLEQFWGIARECDLFVGHNIMNFDLRFIYKRSIILGVRPSRELSFARYRNNPIYDTMCEWEKWGGSIGLHKLCLALGLASPKEAGLDGSKVYDYFLAGKSEEIIAYCKRDVESVRAIYNKVNFINLPTDSGLGFFDQPSAANTLIKL